MGGEVNMAIAQIFCPFQSRGDNGLAKSHAPQVVFHNEETQPGHTVFFAHQGDRAGKLSVLSGNQKEILSFPPVGGKVTLGPLGIGVG